MVERKKQYNYFHYGGNLYKRKNGKWFEHYDLPEDKGKWQEIDKTHLVYRPLSLEYMAYLLMQRKQKRRKMHWKDYEIERKTRLQQRVETAIDEQDDRQSRLVPDLVSNMNDEDWK